MPRYDMAKKAVQRHAVARWYGRFLASGMNGAEAAGRNIYSCSAGAI
ncbi:MAG: hypothetical protein AAF748_16085 [Pseudomonadota bacterium]